MGDKKTYVCFGALVVAEIGVTVPKYEHSCLPVSSKVALYQTEANRERERERGIIRETKDMKGRKLVLQST